MPRTADPLRSIPTDHEAERAVLGAILLDGDALFKVSDRLEPASFDLPRHRIVYESLRELSEKQQGLTLITLRAALEERGLLEQAGGAAFLSQLLDAVPTAAHVEHHAEIVHQKATARALIRTCERIASRGYDAQENVAQLLEDAEREVLSIAVHGAHAGFTSMKEEMQSTFEYIERVQSGQIVGVRTGFEDFDTLTGGLNGGDLAILAARPSVGKTALALHFARNHAVDYNGCVAFFSLEMTKRELVLRLLLGEAQVDNNRFRNGVLSDKDWRRLTQAASVLENARILFDDSMAVDGRRPVGEGAPARPGAEALAAGDRLHPARPGPRRRRAARAAGGRHQPQLEAAGEGPRHPGDRALAAQPRAGEPARQAAAARGPARVRRDRAGRRPGHVRVPRRGLRPREPRRGQGRADHRQAAQRTDRHREVLLRQGARSLPQPVEPQRRAAARSRLRRWTARRLGPPAGGGDVEPPF